MAFFTVLEPPDGKPEGVAFVPEGFSWGALLFTVLWALWHRMWVVAILLFSLFAALTLATNLELLGPGLAALVQFGSALIFAFEARSLQVKSLERVGFQRRGLVQASSCDAVELAYFEGRARIFPVTVASHRRVEQGDTLGIFGNV